MRLSIHRMLAMARKETLHLRRDPRSLGMAFAVDDVEAETHRLKALGVTFTQEPLAMGPVTSAVFDDTCGNLIQ